MKPTLKFLKITVILITCFFSFGVFAQAQHTFKLADSVFLLDNKPFQIISGEMHYPRIPREAWRDRMKMAKAMGLNTIGTYVFWNVHEPQKDHFDFSGNNDIAEFVRIAKEEGYGYCFALVHMYVPNGNSVVIHFGCRILKVYR